MEDGGTDKVTTTNTTKTDTQWNFGSGAQLRTNWLFVSGSFLTFNGPWESSELLGPFTPPTKPWRIYYKRIWKR